MAGIDSATEVRTPARQPGRGSILRPVLQDARSRVESYSRVGDFLGEVDLPGLGSAAGFSGERDDEETFYSFSSYVSPPRIYRYSLMDDSRELYKAVRVAADTDVYETTQVFYASKDGTRVPKFITHRMRRCSMGTADSIFLRRLVTARVSWSGWKWAALSW
ncbi:MAG: hypothetical protein ACE5OQ_15020 [Woeseia sp.]